MRILLAALAVLLMVGCMVVGGYVYISRVAVGVGRVPVMFTLSPSQTPTAPR